MHPNDLQKLGITYPPRPPGLILETTWTNYTPLWTGGYKTLTALEGTDGPVLLGKPTAQALKGKARWLARATLSCLMDKAETYKDVEKAFPVQIRLGDATLELGLIEYLFGTIKAVKKNPRGNSHQQWRSPYKINITTEIIREDYLLTLGMKYKQALRSSKLDKTLINLALRSKQTPSISIYKPNSVQITLKLSRSPGRPDPNVTNKSEFYRAADDFIASLYLTVPFILGIGRATTRGFGRFLPVQDDDLVKGINVGRIDYAAVIAEKLEAITRELTSIDQLREAISVILNSLLSAAQNLVKQAGYDFEEIGEEWRDIPCINYASSRLKIVELAGVTSIEEALNKIGCSVLKYNHKILYIKKKRKYGTKPYKLSGLRFQTWVLGLPRSSEINCVDKRSHASRREYGYLILEKITINDCDNADVKGEKGRRASPLIMLPIKIIDGSYAVILLPVPARDLVSLITNGEHGILHHFGGTMIGINDKKRPCCKPHIIPVRDILFSRRSFFNTKCCDQRRNLKLGVVDPVRGRTVRYNTIHDYNKIINNVFWLVLDSVVEILGDPNICSSKHGG